MDGREFGGGLLPKEEDDGGPPPPRPSPSSFCLLLTDRLCPDAAPAPRGTAPEWPLSWGGVGRPALPALRSARPQSPSTCSPAAEPLGFFPPLEILILLNRVPLPFLAFGA